MAKLLRLDAALQQLPTGPARPAPGAELTVHRQLPGRPAYSADLVPAGLAPALQSAALLLCEGGKPARAMLTDELIDELLQPLSLVPFLLGHSKSLMAGKDLALMATAVAEMVQRAFPALTLAEVGVALRRGASGEWKKPDELLLPSLPVIRSWLKAYSEGSRQQALQLLERGHRQQLVLGLPLPDLQADYPARVAELVQVARAAGRAPALVPDGQRPGPGAYRLPANLDTGGLLLAWLRKIGAISPRYGGQFRIMVAEGLLITRQVPRTPAHRSFARLLRTGAVPASHTLAGPWRVGCQKRQLRQWLIYHAARGTDLLTWLQQLAAHYTLTQQSAK